MLETIGIVLVVVALIAVGVFHGSGRIADLMTLRERRQRTNIKKRNRFNKGT